MRNKLLNILFVPKGYFDSASLLLRLFIGFMMLTHGIAKINNFSVLEGSFPNTLGMGSHFSLIMIILTEVGASIFLITGFLTRLAALPLIFAMSIAAFFTMPVFSLSSSELPLMYLAIYIIILITGPGKYSIDNLIYKNFINK